MNRDRQHWLPKAYLRNFSAGSNDTIYSLELFEKPEWKRVGFNDICNTRGYHSHPGIDAQVDQSIVQKYARLIQKVLSIQDTMPLGEILSKDEIADLLLFVRVHLYRNPLFLYRWLQNVIREWVILHPLPPLPDKMRREAPDLTADIRSLRKVNKRTGHLTSGFQKEAFILAHLQRMLAEDSGQFGRQRIIPQFEDRMLRAVQRPEHVPELLTLVYSPEPLFTVDNPFVLSRFPADEVTMTLPLSSHHLLVRDKHMLGDFDPLRALAFLPSASFSTRVLAAAPMDFILVRLKPLPHVIDPADKDAEPDVSQIVEVVYKNIPILERRFSD